MTHPSRWSEETYEKWLRPAVDMGRTGGALQDRPGTSGYCARCLVRELGADFLFVCKPSSHKRLYELLHDDFIHSSGWIKTRNRHKRVELQRFRWMHGLPVRDGADAVQGAWVEFAIERNGERTYTNTFCTRGTGRTSSRPQLANLLATLNLFAFALHAVQDCVSDLWRQGRAQSAHACRWAGRHAKQIPTSA